VPGVAAAALVANQGLVGNRVEERDATHRSVMDSSFQRNAGIVSVNQESGNVNSQANVRVLVFAEGGSMFHQLSLDAAAVRTDNSLISTGGDRETRLTNSFGGTVGIIGVNQSSGNLNQQANFLVLGIGVTLGPETIALSDATLGAVSAGNTLTQGPTGTRSDIILDSFAGFRGIGQVNQSSGDLNVVRNSLGLSLSIVDIR